MRIVFCHVSQNGSQLPMIGPNIPSSCERDTASNSPFDLQRLTFLWMPTSELFSTFLRSYRELISPKELLITIRALLNQMPAIDFQEQFYSKAIQDPLAKKFPLPLYFRRYFLNHLMRELEKENVELFEPLVKEYLALLHGNNEDEDEEEGFNFWYGVTPPLVVEANRQFENVGQRRWPAGDRLTEWVSDSQWEGWRVTELGSGVGLLAAVFARCGADVCATDLPQVLPRLSRNLRHCGLQVSVKDESFHLPADIPSISPSSDSWGTCTVTAFDWTHGEWPPEAFHTDMVVAADGVYDPELGVALAHRLGEYVHGEKCALVACTPRNPDTLSLFRQTLKEYELNQIELENTESYLLLLLVKGNVNPLKSVIKYKE